MRMTILHWRRKVVGVGGCWVGQELNIGMGVAHAVNQQIDLILPVPYEI